MKLFFDTQAKQTESRSDGVGWTAERFGRECEAGRAGDGGAAADRAHVGALRSQRQHCVSGLLVFDTERKDVLCNDRFC